MHDFMTFLSGNGLWMMIIAVVGISTWFKFREKELRAHQELRIREMEHLQKMKELEIELEKTKGTFFQQPSRLTQVLAARAGGRSLPMSPFLIPLAVFAMVVLIVAITQVAKIRNRGNGSSPEAARAGDGAPTQNAGTGIGTRAYKARDLAPRRREA